MQGAESVKKAYTIISDLKKVVQLSAGSADTAGAWPHESLEAESIEEPWVFGPAHPDADFAVSILICCASTRDGAMTREYGPSVVSASQTIDGMQAT